MIASVRLNASACRRAFKITQDCPLSTGNRRVICAVDVLAFLKAEDRIDDACCERRRIVTAFEHEERPAVAILGCNFSNDAADLTHSRYGDTKIADWIAGYEIITGAYDEQSGPHGPSQCPQRLRPNRYECLRSNSGYGQWDVYECSPASDVVVVRIPRSRICRAGMRRDV